MRVTTVSCMVGDRELTIETGLLAKQANGSVFIRYGDTTALATATLGAARDGDFFPLTVEFEAKSYAAGKIPVTFFRREGRPGEKSILTARMTDRPLRPLFPEGMTNEVQIVINPMSVDPEVSPDVLSALGASAALHISDIPFAGPVGSVRVGWVDGQPVVNPTTSQMAESKLDLMVAGTADAIVMVEAGADELPAADVLTALEAAHEAIKGICAIQEELRQQVGKPKCELNIPPVDEQLKGSVRAKMAGPWRAALGQPGKEAHYDALAQISAQVLEELTADEALAAREREIKRYIHDIEAEVIRKMIADEGIRADGRDLTTVRPIECGVGVVPRAHGTGLFTRGETQVITFATLGTVGDRKQVDWLFEQHTERYYHHYNFPPYSVGETKRMGSPGRREIGHGKLAERALVPVLPTEDEFPYTMRLVSEVLESNGSSSMASVCGSTLSLMDAGVPIKSPVAGVAMGLLQEDGKNIILTDILGLEDHCGDMDFKVCGTEQGITALQMDIKITGLDRAVLEQALGQAEEALAHIRGKLLETISQPREEISPFAPRIEVIQIDPEKIATLIGPGGKTIKKIQEETGVRIDVEQDGRVFVAAPDGDSGQAAGDWVRALTKEVKVGEEYTGPVTRIFGFGAMVEILPGKEGLVHISKLAAERIGRVEDAVNIGDRIPVRVSEIDDQGRINLERTDIPIIVNMSEGGDRDRDRDRGPRDRDRDRG
ncbi:MAG: polyribonucleotide nucleotidyltransferase, partial [Armatimonadetes bacterium]|nr:polyribonucleotide nucleotidyltransferase [Armatimonadota bacterium]